MESEPTNKNKKLIAVAGLIVIVAAIAAGVAAFSPQPNPEVATTGVESPSPAPTSSTLDASTTSPTPTSSPAGPTASTYRDGIYQASGGYHSPGGDETVTVSITLKNGAVSDSTVTTTASNPTGKRYQSMFISNYKSLVTGKNINDIRLSKVSGSSLTSAGFNNALEQIKTQAKS